MSARDDKLAAALLEWSRDPHIPSFDAILARHGLAVVDRRLLKAWEWRMEQWSCADVCGGESKCFYRGLPRCELGDLRAMLAAAKEDSTDA